MSEPFDTPHISANEGLGPEEQKKKKMWRNLFILSLCVTLFLMGIWWLPIKFAQINSFMSTSSMSAKKKKDGSLVMGSNQTTSASNPNLITAQMFVVDARDEEHWSYFDFSRGKQIRIHDRSSLEWDLAFRRGKIISNGGVTNKIGKAALLDLGEISFNAVENVPQKPLVADVHGKTEPENPVLAQWYKYNYLTHKLTARKNVYIMRTADGRYAKLQFMSFYCADKQPGCIQIKYVYQDDGSKTFVKADTGATTTG